MQLIGTYLKYTYEIESEYKLGDKVEFTDIVPKLKGQSGIIMGIVSLKDFTQYIVQFNFKILGGIAKCCLAEMPIETRIFSSDEIKERE